MNTERIFAVFKKEMRRFITDVRMLAALFLPGLLIFVIYTFFSDALTSIYNGSTISPDYSYRIAINQEEEGGKFVPVLDAYFDSIDQAAPEIEYYPSADLDSMKERLKEGELDSLLLFQFADSDTPVSVQAYYNGSSKVSETLYSAISTLVDTAYKPYSFNLGVTPNVGDSSYTQTSIMGFILPMITISLLYSSVISICPESIAGEKDRGTLLAVLATPIKPIELSIGKTLALSVVSIVSGSWSALCTLLSAPKLIGIQNISITPVGYLMFFFVILSLQLLFVAAATLVSALSKSTKEANGYLGPLIAILMVLALIPSFLDASGIGYAFIPFLGSCQSLRIISSGSYDILYFGMSFLSNIIFAGIFAILTSLTFRSERMIRG